MAVDWHGNVILDVHANEGATASDLMTLGQALAALRSREPRIDSVHGLEELLRGTYPQPCEPVPLIPDPDGEMDLGPQGRYRIPQPWRYCFARVTARGVTEEELFAILRQGIAMSVGEVTSMDTGHY